MELDTIMEVNLDTVENESKKKISAASEKKAELQK